jgi:hypothetical protein
MNRFVWDLRHPGDVDFPGMILWAAGLQRAARAAGALPACG